MKETEHAPENTRHRSPPGKLVDVGGYSLHIHVTGNESISGTPTVVLEAGRGDAGLVWATVQPEVAEFARVCSYDRAGLGWSDRGTANPKTAACIVEELHTLLRNAGENPPFVLVGHSIGGLYVRFYAQRYPKEVSGIVLVDPTPEQWEMKGIEWFFDQIVLLGMLWFGFLLNKCRILALLSHMCKFRWPAPCPPAEKQKYAQVNFRDNKVMGAVIEEIKKTPDTLVEAREANLDTVGDIPLVVLSSTPIPIPKGCCSCMGPALERANTKDAEMHMKLAELSTQGRRVVAKKSGHHIQVDDPQLVIDTIKEVVAVAQNSGNT